MDWIGDRCTGEEKRKLLVLAVVVGEFSHVVGYRQIFVHTALE